MNLFLTQLGAYGPELKRNFDGVRRLVGSLGSRFDSKDILLLPEPVGGESHMGEYESVIADLARELGCHIVGGSYYGQRPGANQQWCSGRSYGTNNRALMTSYGLTRSNRNSASLQGTGPDSLRFRAAACSFSSVLTSGIRKFF
jgi:hypothetical protein